MLSFIRAGPAHRQRHGDLGSWAKSAAAQMTKELA